MPVQHRKNFFVKGFTLVELLIVMAIIGVLATILLSSFIGVREKARDGRRKSDLSQIQSALEQYRADQAQYPTSFPSCGSPFNNGAGSVYMQSVPCDPLGASVYNGGNYYYNSDGTNYTLSACVENGNDADVRIGACPSATPSCATAKCYNVSNP